MFGVVPAEVGPLGKVVTQETIGVFMGPALPRAARIAENTWKASVDAELIQPSTTVLYARLPQPIDFEADHRSIALSA